ncbi:hypothetical protein [Enterobacter ludwigii]
MNKQILKNILFNIINFIVNVAIGLALTPYLIKKLGIAAYGLIPLAMFLSSYIGVLTQSLTASVNRFLINELQNNNVRESNKVFNTALVTMLILVVLILFVFAWPVINIEKLITVPIKYEIEAGRLFFLMLLSVLVSLISSIFSVSMYANNRIDLMQCVNIAKNMTRLMAIIIMFSCNFSSLEVFGYAVLISEIIALSMYVNYWRVATPYLNLNIRNFDYSILKKVSNISSWLIVDQIGTIVLSKSDLLLVNKNFGSSVSGKYAIVAQFSDLLRSMASLVGGVMGPVMMILHSQNNQKKMVNLTSVFMMALSLILAIPIVLLCIFSKQILTLWVGNTFNDMSNLMWLLLLPLIINLGTMPLFSINIALNKVKIPSLSNIIFGTVGLSIAFMLLNFSSLGYYSIGIGFIFATTLKNALFTPLYAAYILRVKLNTFLLVHIKTISFTSVFLIICHCVNLYMAPTGYNVFIYMASLCLPGLLLAYFFIDKNSQKEIISILRNKQI